MVNSGGFSSYETMPAWQKTVVDDYLKKVRVVAALHEHRRRVTSIARAGAEAAARPVQPEESRVPRRVRFVRVAFVCHCLHVD